MTLKNMKNRSGRRRVLAVCMITVLCAVLAGCAPAVSDANGTTAPEVTPPATTVPEVTVPDYAGLILGAPQEFTVKLYKNYASSLNAADLVEAEKTEDADGNRYYYYPVQAGKYRYVVFRAGYYTVIKNIYVSETETANGVLLQASSGKMAGNGFEPSEVTLYTDAVLDKVVPSDKSLWPDYQYAFASPYFTDTDRAEHQYTTQEELEAYIAALDGDQDNMYVYSLGVTDKYKHNIPIVIFTQTDLSGAKTIQEAAALVQANNKLTIHYQAQIHGDEPAACEAALAVIGLMQQTYGADMLHDVNMYVIPRLNPDGAHDYTLGDGSGTNLNRDMLTVQCTEVILQHEVINLFDPEVFIDGHEFTTNAERKEDAFRDIMIATGWYSANSQEFIDLCEEVGKLPFDVLRAQGLTPTYYLDNTNSYNSVLSGTGYAGQRGSLAILIESRGTNSGTMMYERRLAGQIITIKTVLDYVQNNHQNIQKTVDNEKQRIIDQGKTYEKTDYIALSNKVKKHAELTYTLQSWDTATATVVQEKKIIPASLQLPNPVRIRPTAYVIPAGEAWSEAVLDIMERHEIVYETLPAGSSVYLQQYTGSIQYAALTEEQKVTFEKGAFVFTMDQSAGNILAMLMEPDVSDIYTTTTGGEITGTLAQEGIIPVENEAFPIYRYIRDLNQQGQIDLA